MLRRQFLTTAPVALTAAAAGAALVPAVARAQSATIVDLAVATPDLSTLVTAVTEAGLAETLSGPGPFTVFAPTNDAFAALPAGTVESLLRPENRDQLVSILTYHVSPASYPAEAIVGQRGRIPTVQGDFLRADGTGGGVMLNNSVNVTTADIIASNGVVHLIDAVLLPH
ncbi:MULTISPECIES: fasciclin domain-containing protein [Paracoccaceae]|jgi:uncharacterized surface protein with fasciclin (FAS1) repeats|uniref:fasciclin domain-containing protein n=1 Tax=Rhodobacterales TaxID=204455 RepID=UPI001D0B5943|nr:fasciclin domain-containing protein [Boseongicola sp. H5]